MLHGRGHIRILDFLRGIAALLVVLLHFGGGGLPTLRGTGIEHTCHLGVYGVHVFFVISGFVIPLALYRAGYTKADFFRHIGRRFVRIDPPAYLSLILVAALYYGSILIKGEPIRGMSWPGLGWRPLLGNLTYTVDYLDTMWYNGVFWTLAIEFQFYIFVGLALPLLLRDKGTYAPVILAAVLLLAFVPFYSFFVFAPFFVLGTTLFLWRDRFLKKTSAAFVGSMAVLCAYLLHGVPATQFALAAAACIQLFDFSTRITDHLGRISFSLYLTHLFTGWSAEIVVSRLFFVPDTVGEKLVMLVVYVIAAVAFATLFYVAVERPFLKLSKKIELKKNSSQHWQRRGGKLRPKKSQRSSIHTGA